jgi:hypothetical protein
LGLLLRLWALSLAVSAAAATGLARRLASVALAAVRSGGVWASLLAAVWAGLSVVPFRGFAAAGGLAVGLGEVLAGEVDPPLRIDLHNLDYDVVANFDGIFDASEAFA